MLLPKFIPPPLCELCMRLSIVNIGNLLNKCLYIFSRYGYPINAQPIRNCKKLASSSSVRYVFLPLLVFIWTFPATLSCNVDFVLFSMYTYAHFACLHSLAFLIRADCAVFCVTVKVPKCSDIGEVHIQSILANESCNSWLQQYLPNNTNWWTTSCVYKRRHLVHSSLPVAKSFCYMLLLSNERQWAKWG